MTENINSRQHDIFHTPIWGFVMNSEKYHAEDYLEKILHLRQDSVGVTRSNFLGWQSVSDLHTHGVFRELIGTIENIASPILKKYNQLPQKINSMWANVNHQYCSNGAHVHQGTLSGVFYLRVPKNSGKLVFVNPSVRSDAHPIRADNYSVQPELYALILFPSWLEHYVEQNLSSQERISISFNIG